MGTDLIQSRARSIHQRPVLAVAAEVLTGDALPADDPATILNAIGASGCTVTAAELAALAGAGRAATARIAALLVARTPGRGLPAPAVSPVRPLVSSGV